VPPTQKGGNHTKGVKKGEWIGGKIGSAIIKSLIAQGRRGKTIGIQKKICGGARALKNGRKEGEKKGGGSDSVRRVLSKFFGMKTKPKGLQQIGGEKSRRSGP